MALVVGIDPGLRGAIVLFDPEIFSPVAVNTMPVKDKKFDPRGICELLKSIRQSDPIFVLEKVNAFQGASSSSSFTFGYGYGLLCGILAGLDARTLYVPPREWTRWAHTGTDAHQNPKLRSRRSAERLWAGMDWSHDGITDAALIAAYGSIHLGRVTDPVPHPMEDPDNDDFDFLADEF